jgi:hypothetical protein
MSGERTADPAPHFALQRARHRERFVKAQNDAKAALLRHHSIQGDYMQPAVAAKLSMIAAIQEEQLAAFDRATNLILFGFDPSDYPELGWGDHGC